MRFREAQRHSFKSKKLYAMQLQLKLFNHQNKSSKQEQANCKTRQGERESYHGKLNKSNAGMVVIVSKPQTKNLQHIYIYIYLKIYIYLIVEQKQKKIHNGIPKPNPYLSANHFKEAFQLNLTNLQYLRNKKTLMNVSFSKELSR